MTGREPAFLRWLALAAMVDWLVTRTLARAAIFMPKAPPVLAVYRALILGGQVASALGALLALLGMGWLAWQFWKASKGLLSLALLGLAAFSLVSLVIPPEGLIQLIAHLLYLVAFVWIGFEAWRRKTSAADKIAILLPALALFTGGLYQASQVMYSAFGLPGSPGFALGLFNLGELFVVLTPIGIWWAYRYRGYASLTYLLTPPLPTPSPITGGGGISGISSPLPSQVMGAEGLIAAKQRLETMGGWVNNNSSTIVTTPGERAVPLERGSIWLGRSIASSLPAAIPAIGFAAFTLANPSMAGILAIWSTGLTLYLPWPVYALSLWLFGVTFLSFRRQDHPAAWALLLLAAGGYAPQLSSQVFYGLIGLSLLSLYSLKSDLRVSSVREVISSRAAYLRDFHNAS